MSQSTELRPEETQTQQNTPLQTSTDAVTSLSLSFADLVVDGSLSPIQVKLRNTEHRKPFHLCDELLIELQCEV